MVRKEKKQLETWYYYTPRDLQVARVDRQCIVRFCDALSHFVHNVKVVTVKIKLSEYENKTDNLYSLYGIGKRIQFIGLEAKIHQDDESITARIKQILLLSIFSFKEFILKHQKNMSVVYLKNYSYVFMMLLLRVFMKTKLLILFEIHRLPKNIFQRYLVEKTNGIIANSYRLAQDIKKSMSRISVKVMGIHQGVDIDYINRIRISKSEARRKLKLPEETFLLIYTGKVYYGYKEIDYYIKLSELIDASMKIIVVGGRSDQVAKFRNLCFKNNNIEFISFVPPSEVFYYQFAADVLLLYYPEGFDINEYRSPGKLFEYMASGNPIVVADYPVLHEIVEHNESAYFVKKDDPLALFQGIMQLKDNKFLRETLAQNALEKVKLFTWENRAEQIVKFAESLLI
ncbi:MAG: glycosyltransferase [Ignavibacteria bacterium]